MYLAAAGVGTLGIVDYDDGRLQQPAAPAASHDRGTSADRRSSRRPSGCSAINPGVRVEAHRLALSSANALDLFSALRPRRRRHRQLPDALPGERRGRADAAALTSTAASSASKGRRRCSPRRTAPATAASIPEPPPPGLVPSCAEGGVLGVLPGIIGTIQATEALKLILKAGEPLVGRLLIFDALRMRFREVRLQRDPDCPVCGDTPDDPGTAGLRAVLRPAAPAASHARRRLRHHARGAEGGARSGATARSCSTCASRWSTRSIACPGRS